MCAECDVSHWFFPVIRVRCRFSNDSSRPRSMGMRASGFMFRGGKSCMHVIGCSFVQTDCLISIFLYRRFHFFLSFSWFFGWACNDFYFICYNLIIFEHISAALIQKKMFFLYYISLPCSIVQHESLKDIAVGLSNHWRASIARDTCTNMYARAFAACMRNIRQSVFSVEEKWAAHIVRVRS